MHRLHALVYLAELLYEVALAMADGSYYRDDIEEGPPPYIERGNFALGGGD